MLHLLAGSSLNLPVREFAHWHAHWSKFARDDVHEEKTSVRTLRGAAPSDLPARSRLLRARREHGLRRVDIRGAISNRRCHHITARGRVHEAA